MSYQVIRLGTDHTQSVQAYIKDYLFSNWNLTDPLDKSNKGKLQFSTGWFQKLPQFQVCVRHDIDKFARTRTLGNRPIKQIDDLIQVHCWEQAQTDDAEPVNLDKMGREVQRIINSDTSGLSTTAGVFNMSCGSSRILPMEDSQAAIFHSVQRIEVDYAKRFI